MNQREHWRPVLIAQTKLWQAKPYQQLLSELVDEQVYEVHHETKACQVEVSILENKNDYLHVIVSVDDGSIPASFRPLTEVFIVEKPKQPAVAKS